MEIRRGLLCGTGDEQNATLQNRVEARITVKARMCAGTHFRFRSPVLFAPRGCPDMCTCDMASGSLHVQLPRGFAHMCTCDMCASSTWQVRGTTLAAPPHQKHSVVPARARHGPPTCRAGAPKEAPSTRLTRHENTLPRACPEKAKIRKKPCQDSCPANFSLALPK